MEAVREMHEGSSAAWHDYRRAAGVSHGRHAVGRRAGGHRAARRRLGGRRRVRGRRPPGTRAGGSSGAWSRRKPEAGSRRPPVSRVLFVMLHPGYVRYFESGIRALAGAGHAVHVAFEISRDKLNESDVAARLATLTPLVTCGPAPDRTESVRDFLARGDRTATRSGQPRRRLTTETAWSSLATTVRLMEDYLRFFEPAFAAATALKARAEKRLPRFYRPFVRAAARAGAGGRRALAGLLALSERVIPTSPAIDAFIRAPGPRSHARDPARRAGLAAGGLREERQAPGRAQRAVGGQLGQPDQQGPDPRAARPRDRVERGAARRGGHAAPRAGGARRGHRRAALRRVVRGAAQPIARGVLP